MESASAPVMLKRLVPSSKASEAPETQDFSAIVSTVMLSYMFPDQRGSVSF